MYKKLYLIKENYNKIKALIGKKVVVTYGENSEITAILKLADVIEKSEGIKIICYGDDYKPTFSWKTTYIIYKEDIIIIDGEEYM